MYIKVMFVCTILSTLAAMAVTVGPLVVLVPRLGSALTKLIAEYCPKWRCELCGEGTPVWLKDSDCVWQLWCLTCALDWLPDDAWPSIENCLSSVGGQPSAATVAEHVI